MSSWEENRLLIQKTLDRLEAGQEKVSDALAQLSDLHAASMARLTAELERLKERSSIWGAFSGLMVSALFAIITYILRTGNKS